MPNSRRNRKGTDLCLYLKPKPNKKRIKILSFYDAFSPEVTKNPNRKLISAPEIRKELDVPDLPNLLTALLSTKTNTKHHFPHLLFILLLTIIFLILLKAVKVWKVWPFGKKLYYEIWCKTVLKFIVSPEGTEINSPPLQTVSALKRKDTLSSSSTRYVHEESTEIVFKGPAHASQNPLQQLCSLKLRISCLHLLIIIY